VWKKGISFSEAEGLKKNKPSLQTGLIQESVTERDPGHSPEVNT